MLNNETTGSITLNLSSLAEAAVRALRPELTELTAAVKRVEAQQPLLATEAAAEVIGRMPACEGFAEGFATYLAHELSEAGFRLVRLLPPVIVEPERTLTQEERADRWFAPGRRV